MDLEIKQLLVHAVYANAFLRQFSKFLQIARVAQLREQFVKMKVKINPLLYLYIAITCLRYQRQKFLKTIEAVQKAVNSQSKTLAELVSKTNKRS